MEGQGLTREMHAPLGPQPTYTSARTYQSKTISVWGKELILKKKHNKKSKTEDLQTVRHRYLSAIRKLVVMKIIMVVWRKWLLLNVCCERVVLGQCAGLCSGLLF